MMAFFTVVMASYLLLLLLLIRGWNRPGARVPASETVKQGISVLVPFRNEANHLHHLIRSITELDYPQDYFEVILINDHSTDNSENVLKALIHDKPGFRILNSAPEANGKKQALTLGVNAASYEMVATTDADCVVPVNWLSRINEGLSDQSIKMVFGGVALKPSGSFFSRLQVMEFASLIGSGAASLGLGHFTMCNGANLAFRKKAFQQVNGYEGNLDIASGDDEFLARKLLKEYPKSVQFLKKPDAVVLSRPQSTIRSFIHQRLRWAGKWKYNSSFYSRLLAVHILLVQLAILGLMLFLSMQWGNFYWGLSLLAIKWTMEGLYLLPVCKFLNIRWSWSAFLILQLIYPFYVIGIGIVSQKTAYEWKGRRLSHKM